MVGLFLLIVSSSRKNTRRKTYMGSLSRVDMHGKRPMGIDDKVRVIR